jgi:hypothetical protein
MTRSTQIFIFSGDRKRGKTKPSEKKEERVKVAKGNLAPTYRGLRMSRMRHWLRLLFAAPITIGESGNLFGFETDLYSQCES